MALQIVLAITLKRQKYIINQLACQAGQDPSLVRQPCLASIAESDCSIAKRRVVQLMFGVLYTTARVERLVRNMSIHYAPSLVIPFPALRHIIQAFFYIKCSIE